MGAGERAAGQAQAAQVNTPARRPGGVGVGGPLRRARPWLAAPALLVVSIRLGGPQECRAGAMRLAVLPSRFLFSPRLCDFS